MSILTSIDNYNNNQYVTFQRKLSKISHNSCEFCGRQTNNKTSCGIFVCQKCIGCCINCNGYNEKCLFKIKE